MGQAGCRDPRGALVLSLFAERHRFAAAATEEARAALLESVLRRAIAEARAVDGWRGPLPGLDAALRDLTELVPLPPLVDAEVVPGGLAEAQAMYPSVHFGATALRKVLPGLAAAGEAPRALALARAIPDEGERGTAMALVAPHLPPLEREPVLAEALAIIDRVPPAYGHGPGDCLGRVARVLVPLGYLPLLLDCKAASAPEALAEMIAVASPEDRGELMPDFTARAEVTLLRRFPRELTADVLWPRWLGRIAEAAPHGARGLLDVDGDWDISEWCPLAASLAGDEGLAAVARALREG